MKWIKCEDEMPGDLTSVIGTDGDWVGQCYWSLINSQVSWTPEDNCTSDLYIKYWMPLPKLPEENCDE